MTYKRRRHDAVKGSRRRPGWRFVVVGVMILAPGCGTEVAKTPPIHPTSVNAAPAHQSARGTRAPGTHHKYPSSWTPNQTTGVPVDLIPASIMADSSTVAYVVNQTNVDPNEEAVSGQIMTTSDGGQSWTQVAPWGVGDPLSGGPCLPNGGGAPLVSFADATNGWALFGSGLAMGSQIKCLYRTTDGGKTWTHLLTAQGQAGEALPFVGDIVSMGFSRSATGLVAFSGGIAPVVYETTDGGSTWTKQNFPQAVLDLAVAVNIDEPEGLQTPDVGILTNTHNQWTYTLYGQAAGSWSEVASATLPFGDGSNQTVVADLPNGTVGWAYSGGTWESTTDGGETWTTHPMQAGVVLQEATTISVSSDGTLWAIGGGQIVRGEMGLSALEDLSIK